MICKDCLAKLSPDGSVDYIELCPRHEDMERKHVAVEGMLATLEATLANAVAILKLAEQHQKRAKKREEGQ